MLSGIEVLIVVYPYGVQGGYTGGVFAADSQKGYSDFCTKIIDYTLNTLKHPKGIPTPSIQDSKSVLPYLIYTIEITIG
jgi:hypothetical protein